MSAAEILASLDHPGASVARVRAANWRTWRGLGPAPVSALTEVAVLSRNGSVRVADAGELNWRHDMAPDGADPEDIVAYRVRSRARTVQQ